MWGLFVASSAPEQVPVHVNSWSLSWDSTQYGTHLSLHPLHDGLTGHGITMS